MKLMFLSSGPHVPTARFRVMHLVPHLRNAGHHCTIAHSFPEKYDYFPWMGFRPSQLLKRMVRHWHLLRIKFGRYDAVILERELFHNDTWDMERKLRRVAKTLVLDVDDGVFLNFPNKFPELVKMSDLVIAGNRNLAEWTTRLNPQVAIIPTCVDIDMFHPVPKDAAKASRPIIGWIGTAGNVSYLHEVASALSALARRFDFELRIVAGAPGVLDDLDLQDVDVRFVKWDPATEAAEVARFDIGLMPLRDDEWSKYKCGLKLLQYMSCAVPGVASPVGVNVDIIDQGTNGFLAASPDQWEDALAQLLSDPPRRRQIGTTARKTVEDRYSIRANVNLWVDAVDKATRRSG
jgi:glycosyltransferase involved in cell wall biosynthesis